MTGYLIGGGIVCFALGMFVAERSRSLSLREVEDERKRHIDLGYDAAHDDTRNDDELINMASAHMHPDDAGEWWPFDEMLPDSVRLSAPKCTEGMPRWCVARRRQLVIAASLLCAEIDRMDRESKASRRMTEQHFQLIWLVALVGLGLLAGAR